MMKQVLALLLVLLLAPSVWSQEAGEGDDAEVEAVEDSATTTTVAGDESEDIDDAELDEQGYGLEEEEDDFIPTQEVSADQSLPFPVDI